MRFFYEYFRPTNDLDIDILTQQCLEMICCCCLVIVRQLEDQLPGGNYCQPCQELLHKPDLCQSTNILSERDSAQMEQKVKHFVISRPINILCTFFTQMPHGLMIAVRQHMNLKALRLHQQ